ncbi:MAG: enoyl-CoA hydratase-related protein [candidate division Zixibacteria bacterium]|nr:enoyl-CoA hydratase-related protein [candidate division Zixibacteria bacterium]
MTVTREGFAATVHLARPETKNAFHPELITELSKVFSALAPDDTLRVVFLRGKGDVFCAGADMNWMKSSLKMTAEQNLEDAQKLSRMLVAINEFPAPVVGLVQGAALGGGIGLLAVCDHVAAESKSVFGLTEVKVGLIPAVVGPFVISKIGLSQARSLFLSGEKFGAATALRIGLVHEMVEGEAGLEEAQRKWAEIFKKTAPGAVRSAKKYLGKWPFPPADINDQAAAWMAQLRTGREAQEGLMAFLERKTPPWAG